MDIEGTLIQKALSTGEIPELVSRGIEPDHFYDEGVREIFEFALEFQDEHGVPPSLSAVKEEFPKFKAKLSSDPVSLHIKKFVRQTSERQAINLLRGYHEALEDPDQIDHIAELAQDMATELAQLIPAPRASRLSDGLKRKEEYDKRKRLGITHGILMGIPSFDAVTLGIQPHELCTFAGFQGMGKTTGMQNTIMSAYLQNKLCLFISLEVEAEQILRKFDVMLSHVRYRAMKALELDMGEEEAWTKILEAAQSDRLERDIIIRDDIKNCTVSKVQNEVYRYKPAIFAVDYLEEMASPKGIFGWAAVEHNGRGLKQNCRVMRVPCVTATQLNREGGKGEVSLGTLSYQSIGKFSDMVIGLDQDENMKAAKQMDWVMLKYRDADNSRLRANLQWDIDRGYIKEVGESERFPKLNGKGLSKKDRSNETEVEVAEVTRGKTNPMLRKLKAQHAAPARRSPSARKPRRIRVTA